MEIKNAKFVTSIVDYQPILDEDKKQIAFIGRSNVGKSSLMNFLLNRKSLVKTSSTPGKTKTINFFLVNNDFYFIDLPGYGYAKMSFRDRAELSRLITWFLLKTSAKNRKLVLVIDAKVGITALDEQMIELLQKNNLRFFLAVNKVDKLNQQEIHKLKSELIPSLPDLCDSVFFMSAFKKKGALAFWEAIKSIYI